MADASNGWRVCSGSIRMPCSGWPRCRGWARIRRSFIAEVGPTASTFASPKRLASWVGACPGDHESAGVNYSHRSPKGNRQMRRLLNQAANAAVKAKGSSSSSSIDVWSHAWARPSHWRHRPSAVSTDLEDTAPVRPVRGARPGRQQTAETSARGEDDPRTPQSRLPCGARAFSIRQSSMSGDDFRPWTEELTRLVPTK